MSLAAVADAEEKALQASLLTEIRTLRRMQQTMDGTLKKIAVSVNGDGNGEQGLRTRVFVIERDLKRASGNYANWIALAACVIAAVSAVISIVK